MSSKRFFYLMNGLVGLLLILAVALVVIGNGMLTKKNTKLTELKLENQVIDQQKISLVQAQKDLEKYSELEKIAKTIVPRDKDQAKAVREIIKFAQESGISIAGVSFPSSTLGQNQPKAAAPAEGEAAPSTPAAPPVTQVKPVEGVSGVYQLEITVQSGTDAANFARLLDFLRRLESNRRTSGVSSLTITPNSDNRNALTFSTIINVYIKP